MGHPGIPLDSETDGDGGKASGGNVCRRDAEGHKLVSSGTSVPLSRRKKSFPPGWYAAQLAALPGYCLRTPLPPPGIVWGPGQPWPTDPQTNIRKICLRQKMKVIKEAGNLRPILRTQTFSLASDAPPPPPPAEGAGFSLHTIACAHLLQFSEPSLFTGNPTGGQPA